MLTPPTCGGGKEAQNDAFKPFTTSCSLEAITSFFCNIC